MYNIIKNTDKHIIKSDLAPFIVNNFFCNYLSGNYMENNLLYLITMILKDEIDKLDSINSLDIFLINTNCGCLLEELRKMPDVQIFFKKIIFQTIEEMERNASFREINFNIFEILNELKKLEKTKGEEGQNLNKIYQNFINGKIFDPGLNLSKDQIFEQNDDIFMQKYIAELRKNEFEQKAEQYKKENKKDLYEYFNKFANDIELSNKNDLFSNTILINNMLDKKFYLYLFSYYKNNFMFIIFYINQLIDNIKNNISLLPNSIKHICKIISILIRNKFKNITKFEENAFISKFIIEILLLPIMSFPGNYALISELIISGNTIKNIEVMNNILKKLFSGKLFQNNKDEGNYTPFNWLFLEKIESIFYIFEKVININLPSFIEKYINEELPKDYNYDFFNENKNIICANLSICFTIENLNNLLNGLKSCEIFQEPNNEKAKKLKRAYSKLINKSVADNIIEVDNQLKNTTKKDEKDRKIIKNYYLFNDLAIEDKYKVLFSINNQIANFYINKRKLKEYNNLNEKEKNVIKIKNYLSSSLGNFKLLNKTDFNISSTSDIIKMLNEIKTYMTLPNFILDNNTIPSKWYITSLLDYLNKIPDEYIENNYKKLFSELTQNINESINVLDFEILILFRNKLKFLHKCFDYYENVLKLKNSITINDNIKLIAEQAFIPVDLYFKYDKNEKKFELKRSNLKDKAFEDKIMHEDSKKRFKSLKTIEAFTRYFPHLTKYEINKGKDPLEIIKELSISVQINSYFSIIKERITKVDLFKLDKYDSLYSDKIKDYIMNKIYSKLYPSKESEKDKNVYDKCKRLSWVEPNMIVNKDYIFDNMLPEILNEFDQINIAKTPYQKLNNIKNIMKYIDNLIKFNEGIDKEIGAEDITPVLNYVFIKAQPKNICTDIEFTKLFSENYGKYENCLVNFESMCIVIINTTSENFMLSSEEYEKKCEETKRGKDGKIIPP